MRKLSVDDIVKDNENCYSFVAAIAKRARQISEKSNDEGVILDDQPVHMAVKEFVAGKFRIDENGNNGEIEDNVEEKATTEEPVEDKTENPTA